MLGFGELLPLFPPDSSLSSSAPTSLARFKGTSGFCADLVMLVEVTSDFSVVLKLPLASVVWGSFCSGRMYRPPGPLSQSHQQVSREMSTRILPCALGVDKIAELGVTSFALRARSSGDRCVTSCSPSVAPFASRKPLFSGHRRRAKKRGAVIWSVVHG